MKQNVVLVVSAQLIGFNYKGLNNIQMKAQIINKLLYIFQKDKHQRFLQLLCNIMPKICDNDPFYYTDKQFLDSLNSYIERNIHE